MAYTFDTVEGKIVNVKVNGKPVMKSYQNALNKAQETVFWRFNGDLIISITNWVFKWQAYYGQGIMPGMVYKEGHKLPPVSTFDNMRYLVLALDSEYYMNVLD